MMRGEEKDSAPKQSRIVLLCRKHVKWKCQNILLRNISFSFLEQICIAEAWSIYIYMSMVFHIFLPKCAKFYSMSIFCTFRLLVNFLFLNKYTIYTKKFFITCEFICEHMYEIYICRTLIGLKGK